MEKVSQETIKEETVLEKMEHLKQEICNYKKINVDGIFQKEIDELQQELDEYKEYYKEDGTPITLPLRSEKELTSKKGVNYMNYAILIYLSKYQDLHEVEGFDGFDTDRYLFEQHIIKNKDLIEEYSKTKITTFIKNARKLSKVTDSDFVSVEKTKKGEIVYRMGKGKRDNGLYVCIERKILEVLITCTNDRMIKTYMFFKWRLRNGGRVITRKEMVDYMGYSIKSHRELEKLSKDIETFLVKLGLIRKELITSMSVEEGEYNRSCYYELVPYDEWIEFWNNKKNAIDFK